MPDLQLDLLIISANSTIMMWKTTEQVTFLVWDKFTNSNFFFGNFQYILGEKDNFLFLHRGWVGVRLPQTKIIKFFLELKNRGLKNFYSPKKVSSVLDRIYPSVPVCLENVLPMNS